MTDLTKQIRAGHAIGWSFTPLNGKRPRLNGWQEAPRASLDQSLQWAAEGNIGLRTGQASGIGVIDIEAGAAVDRSEFPKTATVFTGGGGYHLYYSVDRPLKNAVGAKKPAIRHPRTGEPVLKVDIRGDGGQVVYVGSTHPETGKPYRWFAFHKPGQVEIAPFPYDLIIEADKARQPLPKPTGPINPDDNAERRAMAYVAKCEPSIAGQGGHNAAFRVACKCWQFGLAEIAVWRVMQWYNANRCEPPWSEKELAHKIGSSRDVVARAGEIGAMLATDDELEELESF